MLFAQPAYSTSVPVGVGNGIGTELAPGIDGIHSGATLAPGVGDDGGSIGDITTPSTPSSQFSCDQVPTCESMGFVYTKLECIQANLPHLPCPLGGNMVFCSIPMVGNDVVSGISCDEGSEVFLNGQCVPRCPAGVYRDENDNCTICSDSTKEWVESAMMCLPKCPWGVSRDENDVCNDYCDEPSKELVDGICVPRCGGGSERDEYGDCSCESVKANSTYNPVTKMCECNEGLEEVEGTCVGS